MYMYP